MSYTQDVIECPNCKDGECFYELNCNTGEEFVFCEKCGYYFHSEFKTDENNKYILKDTTKQATMDNIEVDVIEIKNPYGVYKIELDGVSKQNFLATEEDYIAFKNNVDLSVEKCSIKISRFVNNEFINETLI